MTILKLSVMDNKRDMFKLSDLANLRLRIFVIGYASRGESTVVLFMDGDDVVYSLVIDCCSYRRLNKTLEILDHYNINDQKLNMLCWSHPDIDHTLGMNNLLSDYCNEQTKILTPLGIVNSSHIVIKSNKKDECILSLIKKINDSKQLAQKTVCVDDGHNKPYGFSFVSGMDRYDVQINALSPMESFINYHISNMNKIKKNFVSIVLQIRMPGNYNFLFCSDAENDIFNMIDDSPFNDPLFVKIPHHGSNSSEAIFDILQTPMNNTVGCVTCFKSKNLPIPSTMAKYLDRMSRVDYTNQNYSTLTYGTVEYMVDLYDKRTVHIKYEGRAAMYN